MRLTLALVPMSLALVSQAVIAQPGKLARQTDSCSNICNTIAQEITQCGDTDTSCLCTSSNAQELQSCLNCASTDSSASSIAGAINQAASGFNTACAGIATVTIGAGSAPTFSDSAPVPTLSDSGNDGGFGGFSSDDSGNDDFSTPIDGPTQSLGFPAQTTGGVGSSSSGSGSGSGSGFGNGNGGGFGGTQAGGSTNTGGSGGNAQAGQQGGTGQQNGKKSGGSSSGYSTGILSILPFVLVAVI